MLIFKQKFATFNWTLFVLFISLFIRYHNTREVATHKIRNTVTQGEGYDRQARRTRGKFPVSVMPEVCLPMTAPGLRSSLPFRDGEEGHLYV